ncbi:MAG: hypothetical protein C0604_08185, partial [Clostridiales bacterium]
LSFVIMVPLFVTSFDFVRRRIGGKKWKKLHKWSYPAYILMLVHVILVTDNIGHMAIYSFVLFIYVFFKFKNEGTALKIAKFVLLAFLLLNIGKTLISGQEASDLQKPDENLPDIASSGILYKDGTYIGTADGYGPDLTVQVTLEGNSISDIEIVSHNEKGSKFYMPAFDAIPARIIDSQSISVDAVSGSTYSSYGIMNAVGDALSDSIESGSIEEIDTPEHSEEEEHGTGKGKGNGEGLHKGNRE